jgi:hypothetical protein
MSRFTFFALIFVFSINPCFSMPASKLANTLNLILKSKAPSPWYSLGKEKLRFIVVDSKTQKGVAIGYSESDLKAVGIQSLKDSFGNSSIQNVSFPKIDFFTDCRHRGNDLVCGDNQSWTANERTQIEPIRRLAELTQLPVILLANELPDDWKKIAQALKVTEDEVLIQTGLHELFHEFQGNLVPLAPWKITQDKKLLNCFDKDGYNPSPIVLQDVLNWKNVFRALLQSDPKFKSLVLRALKFREESNDPCLDSQSYTTEAEAQFFSFDMMLGSKLFPKERLITYFEYMWLNSVSDVSQNYGVGLVMLLALKRTDPTLKWQKTLETRGSLESLLRETYF